MSSYSVYKIKFSLPFISLLLCTQAFAVTVTCNNYEFEIISGQWEEKIISHEEGFFDRGIRIRENVLELINPYKKEGDKEAFILLNEELPESYWYRFKVKVISGSYFHTLFNAQLKGGQLDSFYQMSIRFSSDNVNLKKKESGYDKFTLIEGPKVNYSGKWWTDCMIVKNKDRILIFVDDMKTPKIDMCDLTPRLEGGRIGLGLIHQYKMHIKDFEFHPESLPLLDVHMTYPETTSIRLGEELKVCFSLGDISKEATVHIKGKVKLYDKKQVKYKFSDTIKVGTDGSFLWKYSPEEEGVYEAVFFLDCGGKSTVKQVYFAVVSTMFAGVAIELKPSKLISDVILTEDIDGKNFCHNKKGIFIEKDSYSYWESGDDRKDYLALKLCVKKEDKPYLIKIKYPDDADRSMSFSLLYPNNIREEEIGGVHTGYDIPVSDGIKEYAAIIWPKKREFTLMAMNWWKSHRAALSRVQIYEFKSETDKKLPVVKTGNHRQFGLWNEDPNGILIPLGINSKQIHDVPPAIAWYCGLNRLSGYMKSLGLNTVYYPVLWYGIGSTYPSEGIGRRLGWPANRYYDDYIKLWCLLAEKYSYEFHAYIVGWGQGDLIHKAIPAYTLYGRPEKGIKDIMQNPLSDIVAGKDAVVLIDNDNKVADGGRGSIGLNPLHHEIRASFNTWLDGFLIRYGNLPAFKGIDIQLSNMANLFCFPSVNAGYGDYTIQLFEKEIGIKVPYKAPDPHRFKKRYEWLRENHWDRWLDWRSNQVVKILQDIEQKVHSFRKDLDVDFELYNFWLRQQKEAEKNNYTSSFIKRDQSGVDLKKLSKINGSRLLRRVSPAYDRYTLARGSPEGFLTKRWAFEHPLIDRFSNGAFFYSKYYEYRYHREERDLFREVNHCGPIAAYINYKGRYALRDWVRQMVNIDPEVIIFGGFGLTSAGREELVREFSNNFIPLPPEKFKVVFNHIQPVTFRMLKKNGQTYFYLVNDTSIPAKVRLSFNNDEKIFSNNEQRFISPDDKDGKHTFTLDMPIYSLRSFEGGAKINIVNLEVSVSANDIEALREKVKSFEMNATIKDKAYNKLQQDLLTAFQEKRYRDVALLFEHPVAWKMVNGRCITKMGKPRKIEISEVK